MIKKVLKKTIIAIVIVLTGIMICQKTPIIKNVKQNIAKQTETFKEDITTIDVTGITLGKETQHEHIYRTMYDETNHWEECNICDEKRNIKKHSLTTTWTAGKENCLPANFYTKTCTCGYVEKGTRPCVWNGKSYNTGGMYYHRKQCSVHQNYIPGTYLGHNKFYYIGSYGNGKLYSADLESSEYIYYDWPSSEQCYTSSGMKIDCNNIGKCTICGITPVKGKHRFRVENDGKLYCMFCKEYFGTWIYDTQINTNTVPPTYTYVSNIKLNKSVDSLATSTEIHDMNSLINTKSSKLVSQNSTKTEFIVNHTVQLKASMKEKFNSYLTCYVTINGISCIIEIPFEQLPDLQKPTISNISIEKVTTWSKSKSITISGTENWTNIIDIEILDDEEKVIYNGSTKVNNQTYSISCTPELEASETEKTFKVIITDACGNKAERTFNISKIDGIPPEVTSNSEISNDWSNEKNITFTATDQGIGNVQIAFNDVNDYSLASKNGTEYSREYKLIGDVYSPRKAKIFYKDELNNITSQEITIDKLDNTAPTITRTSFNNNKLNITAHDRHETEGEGSGVTKYRFITSTTQLENPEITTENSTEVLVNENIIIPEIYKIKYIYAVSEDAVGNISSVYEVEVPQLELTSKVNVSAANGKGAIELDWSNYDIQNKYFVIYRKQEGEEEWKTIVGLEEKFNGNKYVDNLANDKTNPSTPNINIEGKKETNSIEITASGEDNGTRYKYYVESYDANDMSLLSTSKVK